MTITDIENGKRISLVLRNTGGWTSSLQISNLGVSGQGYSLSFNSDNVSDTVIENTESIYHLDSNSFLTLDIDFIAEDVGEFPGIFSLNSNIGEYSWDMSAQVVSATGGVSIFMEVGISEVKKVDHVLKSKIASIR